MKTLVMLAYFAYLVLTALAVDRGRYGKAVLMAGGALMMLAIWHKEGK
jgi:hypothetical protein